MFLMSPHICDMSIHVFPLMYAVHWRTVLHVSPTLTIVHCWVIKVWSRSVVNQGNCESCHACLFRYSSSCTGSDLLLALHLEADGLAFFFFFLSSHQESEKWKVGAVAGSFTAVNKITCVFGHLDTHCRKKTTLMCSLNRTVLCHECFFLTKSLMLYP